jgi:hypothetical protein
MDWSLVVHQTKRVFAGQVTAKDELCAGGAGIRGEPELVVSEDF